MRVSLDRKILNLRQKHKIKDQMLQQKEFAAHPMK